MDVLKYSFFPYLLLTGIILMKTLIQHQQFFNSRRDFEIINTGCSIDHYPFSINA